MAGSWSTSTLHGWIVDVDTMPSTCVFRTEPRRRSHQYILTHRKKMLCPVTASKFTRNSTWILQCMDAYGMGRSLWKGQGRWERLERYDGYAHGYLLPYI
eukprot:67082-Pleurochrysis_carterae.AAC.1